jgi:hypothetical protein
MPITHEIITEIEAIDFTIIEFTARIKTMIGSSDGIATKRENLKMQIQALQSTKSRLKLMHARQTVEQPRLF